LRIDSNVFFRQAAIRICGNLDIEAAMADCLYYIKEFLPADSMTLRHYDAGLDALKTVAVAGDIVPHRIIPLNEIDREDGWSDWEEVRIINEPTQDPIAMRMSQQLGRGLDHSSMIMLLKFQGRRVGGVSVWAKGTGRYTVEHANLLKLLHEPLAIAMANALQHQEVLRLKDMLVDDNRYLQRQLLDVSGSEIMGADFGLKEVMEMVRQVAPLNSPVLLLGETGVGKGIIANTIHNASPRRNKAFINVNCGAIPDTLVDSELFGHEKGAFTGAMAQRRGRFERADKGTIFLDEIGELPPQAQVRLLNVIQNREIERVGGTKSIRVDIRIISATNRNLAEMIRSKGFREDLWFRLNVFPITIPPLRQRREDIPSLVHYFIEKKTMELKMENKPKLAPLAMDRLQSYDWPGNVRELENLVERALIRQRHESLTFEDLVTPETHSFEEKTRDLHENIESLDKITALHIKKAMKLAQWKVEGSGGAAELLKIHPNTLRKKMDKLGILYRRKDRAKRFN